MIKEKLINFCVERKHSHKYSLRTAKKIIIDLESLADKDDNIIRNQKFDYILISNHLKKIKTPKHIRA